MPRVRLSRTVRFNAAHRYYRPEWSAERNEAAFGLCAREHGHGHSYECQVVVVGPLDSETSMVMQLDDFDAILREEVVDRLDHRHINHDVPEFAPGKQIPTAEALAVYVWEKIEPRLPATVTLEVVRVHEEPNLSAEYRGEA